MKSDWNNFVDDRNENSLKYLVAHGANLKIEQIDKTAFFSVFCQFFRGVAILKINLW